MCAHTHTELPVHTLCPGSVKTRHSIGWRKSWTRWAETKQKKILSAPQTHSQGLLKTNEESMETPATAAMGERSVARKNVNKMMVEKGLERIQIQSHARGWEPKPRNLNHGRQVHPLEWGPHRLYPLVSLWNQCHTVWCKLSNCSNYFPCCCNKYQRKAT